MLQPDSPQKLEDTHIDSVPRNIPFRLSSPIMVDGEIAGQSGDCVLVTDNNRFPFETRLLFDAVGRKSPQIAYVTLRVRSLIILIYVAPSLHAGHGEAFVSGVTSITREPKQNIAPSPITAEEITPVTMKAKDLPKNWPIVLAASYQCVEHDRGSTLVKRREEDVPAPSGNPITALLTDSLFLKKGMYFMLEEQDGGLVLKEWGDKSHTVIINPNCELEVCIPEDNEN